MVTQPGKPSRGRNAAGLMVELLVAIALLTGALLPIAFSIASEKRLARTIYERSVAMEIVDGELEILAAGEWKNIGNGTHLYKPKGLALSNLPKGEFIVRIDPSKIRLEWLSRTNASHGSVIREFLMKTNQIDSKEARK